MSRSAAAALVSLSVLAGCGSVSDQLGRSAWVTPGKYQYHSCQQIQGIDNGMAARQKDLEELMERASKGPGGAAIGTMVYQSDYQQVLGERKELAAQLVRKRCQIESPRTSDRQVF